MIPMSEWRLRLAAAAAVAMLAYGGPAARETAPPQGPPSAPPLQAPPASPPQSPPAQDPQQRPPVFRAGVQLVRVDVTVTGRDDQPVSDLQAADFEVTEDGVPQTVEQAQFLRLDGHRPTGDETSLEIRNQSQAEAEAAREDVRLFALFLDDYHIDKAPDITLPLRRGLSEFVRNLWPTDLIAIMDPLTPLSSLRFTRSQPDLLRVISTFEGRQGELFPVKGPLEEAQWASGQVRRLRAEVTFSALTALTMKLGGMREGRKTIIFVSQGPPVFLGFRDGNLQQNMRDITEAANRGNVTIYAVDPRGLGGEARLGARDTLYQLAGETGGRAIVNTNDFSVGLGRLLRETSGYYVIGYTPTRTEDDGKFHKISVRVKRPGTRVLARQGYWAPSGREMQAAAEAMARAESPENVRLATAAAQTDPTKRKAAVWAGVSPGPEGLTLVHVSWEPADAANAEQLATLGIEVLPPAGGTPVVAPVRWPATVPGKAVPATVPMALPPGTYQFRFLARTADDGIADDWRQSVTIPDFAGLPVGLSSARAFRARSLAEWRALEAEPDPQPVAVWSFRRTERAQVAVSAFAATGTPSIEALILSRDGKELTRLPLPAVRDGRVRFELPVRSFGQGVYMLRLLAKLGDQTAEQLVAFRIVP